MRVNGQPERWLVAARLSRMSKRDRERGDEIITGIQTQDLRSAEWAKQEGHTIVHVTRDKNVSGAIPPWERPELGPWLTDPVKLVQYDGIVAYEVQRLSRGGNYDVAWLRRWADQHNKKLYVIKERLRWPDRRDGMLWAVEAERAEQDGRQPDHGGLVRRSRDGEPDRLRERGAGRVGTRAHQVGHQAARLPGSPMTSTMPGWRNSGPNGTA